MDCNARKVGKWFCYIKSSCKLVLRFKVVPRREDMTRRMDMDVQVFNMFMSGRSSVCPAFNKRVQLMFILLNLMAVAAPLKTIYNTWCDW